MASLPTSSAEPVAIFSMVQADWPGVRAVHAQGIATGHATFETEPAASWEAFDAGKTIEHRLVARAGDGALLG